VSSPPAYSFSQVSEILRNDKPKGQLVFSKGVGLMTRRMPIVYTNARPDSWFVKFGKLILICQANIWKDKKINKAFFDNVHSNQNLFVALVAGAKPSTKKCPFQLLRLIYLFGNAEETLHSQLEKRYGLPLGHGPPVENHCTRLREMLKARIPGNKVSFHSYRE